MSSVVSDHFHWSSMLSVTAFHDAYHVTFLLPIALLNSVLGVQLLRIGFGFQFFTLDKSINPNQPCVLYAYIMMRRPRHLNSTYLPLHPSLHSVFVQSTFPSRCLCVQVTGTGKSLMMEVLAIYATLPLLEPWCVKVTSMLTYTYRNRRSILAKRYEANYHFLPVHNWASHRDGEKDVLFSMQPWQQ